MFCFEMRGLARGGEGIWEGWNGMAMGCWKSVKWKRKSDLFE